ncbi:hypothetical protein [Pseudonocardia sp. NPDC049635]|uniref:hypothetical protein n=1 Tax=Pseudonocardia sp. NPDC049635 TaxID=3155506 RepID=UPI003410F1B8
MTIFRCYNFAAFDMATKFGWVDGKPGIAATLPASDGLRSLTDSLGESVSEAGRRITDLEVAWQGTASDAARNSLTATTSGMADTAAVTGNGAERLIDHGHSFETMRRQITYVDPADHSWYQRALDNTSEAWHSLWGNGADHVTIAERNLANDEIANRALDRYAAETTATDDRFTAATPPPPAGPPGTDPHNPGAGAVLPGTGGGPPQTAGPGAPTVPPPITGPPGPAPDTTGPPGPRPGGPDPGTAGGSTHPGPVGPERAGPPTTHRPDTVTQAEVTPGPPERPPGPHTGPGAQQAPDRPWTGDRTNHPFPPSTHTGPGPLRHREQLARDFADRARQQQLVPGAVRLPRGGSEQHLPPGRGSGWGPPGGRTGAVEPVSPPRQTDPRGSSLPGAYGPMTGAGAAAGAGQEHRNRYVLPTDEVFDIDVTATDPVLGPDEDHR